MYVVCERIGGHGAAWSYEGQRVYRDIDAAARIARGRSRRRGGVPVHVVMGVTPDRSWIVESYVRGELRDG